MKIKITCPHCVGMGQPSAACGWCRGFGEVIQSERVCPHCLPSEDDCPACGGTHRQRVTYPARNRSELELLPSEYLKEEN